jgi:hypothetical protein
MRHSLTFALSAIALASCHPSHDATPEPHGEIVSIAPAIDAAARIEDASVDAARPVETDSPAVVGFISDGTLVVAGHKVMIARSRTGEIARYRLPEGGAVDLAPDLRGVVVVNETNATLLATPQLTVLYDGPGAALQGSANVVLVARDHALVFQKGDALGRLVLPGEAEAARSVRVVAHETRADVTFELETNNGTKESASLYDLATGARIGRGVPTNTSYATLPLGAMLDTVGFLVEGKTVSRIDLEKGVVVRRGPIACGADLPVANPTPSPNGDLLLVTCGNDAVILDATTLASRRRIPSVMPGCDNGPYLGGEILKDGRTLRLDGCGGEARLDLQTAKYACADDPGLLGAPYDMGMGVPHGPRVPTGREHVARCARGDSPTSRLGTSEKYRLDQSDHYAVVFDGGSVALEENVGFPVLAPDESTIAYTADDKVVVRSLPDGKVVAELRLGAPQGAHE